MNSQYLGPVIPGTIADIEEKQNKIECLTEEIKELEWNIESLEKMMEYYKKREKKEPVMNNFSFEVYWKDEITARVYVKKKESHCIALYGESGKTIICIKRDDAFSTGKDYGNEMLGEGKTGYQ